MNTVRSRSGWVLFGLIVGIVVLDLPENIIPPQIAAAQTLPPQAESPSRVLSIWFANPPDNATPSPTPDIPIEPTPTPPVVPEPAAGGLVGLGLLVGLFGLFAAMRRRMKR